MKKLVVLSVLAVVLTACHSITVPTPYGQAKAVSFGQKTAIAELSLSTNGVLQLKGYNNDQLSAVLAALQLMQGMAAKAAGAP